MGAVPVGGKEVSFGVEYGEGEEMCEEGIWSRREEGRWLELTNYEIVMERLSSMLGCVANATEEGLVFSKILVTEDASIRDASC